MNDIDYNAVIEIINSFLSNEKVEIYGISYGEEFQLRQAIENLLKERQADKDRIKELEEYANWHIEHLTEDIADYIDDDKVGNANIIGEFKEEREHWRDINRILNNKETYIDYKNY